MNKCRDDALKKFKVITTTQFFYIVEAKNKDDALDKCLKGEIEVYDSSVINDEVKEW